MGKTIVVGKDTRKSGDMLEAAVVAGITSAGGDALLTGLFLRRPWRCWFANCMPMAVS